MPRSASPFYYPQDQAVGAQIGASLGKALFGDPELAAQVALRRAQMENYSASADEARAHAGLYHSQQDGQDGQNTASSSLGQLIAGLFPQQPAAAAAPAPAPVDPLAPLPDATAAPAAAAAPAAPAVTFDPQSFRNGLPGLFTALAQMQGDKVDPNKVIGGLAAMFGNDEFARRGMVGEGVTPGENFALTPERADDIRQQGFDASYKKDTAVAGINHVSDIPVARIQQQTSERGQDVSASTTRRGQDLEHGDRVYGINVKAGADIENPAGANVIARALGPDAVITDNARTKQQADAIYAEQHPGKAPPEHSNHYAEQGFTAFDVRPIPGMTFEDARRKVAEQAAAQGGYLSPDTRDEGTHWHMVVKGVKASTKTAGAQGGGKQKQISSATNTMLAQLIDANAKAHGFNLSPGAKQNMMASAARLYQQSGNPDDAVGQVFTALKRNIAKGKGGDPNTVRQQAIAAISQGADKSAVNARLKSMGIQGV